MLTYYITISVRSCRQRLPSFLPNHHPLCLAFQNILLSQFLSLCVFMSHHFYRLSVSLRASHPDELPNVRRSQLHYKGQMGWSQTPRILKKLKDNLQSKSQSLTSQMSIPLTVNLYVH